MFRSCRFCLCDTLITLYQQSLNSHQIPFIWKTSEIIPVPKIKNLIEMNDPILMASISIVMKCLENTIKQNVFSTVKSHIDPYYFLYMESRDVKDANNN